MVKMVKTVERRTTRALSLGKECKICDIVFEYETDFKDHILTTVHKGPSDGTRNFNYRLTATHRGIQAIFLPLGAPNNVVYMG